jgi:DoxX-like family
VPCAVALLVPRFPRLKEWAYTAAVFTCTGAAASHLAVADGAGALVPIIFAVIALASWSLRPSARRDLAPGPSSWILARPFASRKNAAWAKYGWGSTVTMGRPRRTKEPS